MTTNQHYEAWAIRKPICCITYVAAIKVAALAPPIIGGASGPMTPLAPMPVVVVAFWTEPVPVAESLEKRASLPTTRDTTK